MSNFVPLEDAAKKLGVSTDELIDMRSRGDIFGYRDGGSWKFKPEEIERVAAELGGVLDEDPAGSSLLVTGSDVSPDGNGGSAAGSDISLVPDEGADSDVRLVAGGSDAGELQLAADDDDDDELNLSSDIDDDLLASASGASSISGSELGSDLDLAGSGIGSDVPVSPSDALDLVSSNDSNVLGESDLNLEGSAIGSGVIKGDSDPAVESGLDIQGSDLELSDDGDLVLGGGSDLALGTDSGINLMSPADSGISLEDEPLDLAASGISGLDLAAEGSDIEGASSASGVDFQQDEEFQLSPSGSLDNDDDSGSQVIELEDSSEFGDAAVAVPAEDGFDAFADVDGGGGLDEAGDALADSAPAPAAMVGAPEVPYNLLQVLSLLGILLLMCLSGILVTDIVRNMWASAGDGDMLTSGLTDAIVSAFGMK